MKPDSTNTCSQPIEWTTWHPHKAGKKKKKLFLFYTPKRDFRIMKDAFSLQPRDGCPLHPESYWWWSWSYKRVKKKKKGSGKEVLFSRLLSRMWPTWLRFPSVMRLDCAKHAQNGTMPLEAQKRRWASKNKISKLKFENPRFRLGSPSS